MSTADPRTRRDERAARNARTRTPRTSPFARRGGERPRELVVHGLEAPHPRGAAAEERVEVGPGQPGAGAQDAKPLHHLAERAAIHLPRNIRQAVQDLARTLHLRMRAQAIHEERGAAPLRRQDDGAYASGVSLLHFCPASWLSCAAPAHRGDEPPHETQLFQREDAE